jgi:hypothetical protein
MAGPWEGGRERAELFPIETDKWNEKCSKYYGVNRF